MITRSFAYTPEVKNKKELDFESRCFLEGYALACSDLAVKFTGESLAYKSYDPLTVEGDTLHSYAFEFKDGGRHHDANLYNSVGEIMSAMSNETFTLIMDGLND